ncbi:hypothetical protein [Prochlorococcus marinus]|uniref:hypothetical protein n=1 Tax=Prochlorococcus marinus TaxID=1219 RepID=UPI0022B568C8|nr:hypothetical protein [Prochlorococcus marinus]
MDFSGLAKISPLYDYWLSAQTDENEEQRLLLANLESKASYLFEKEPYKWENLFQSIAREIINGDLESIRGMKILLSTIKSDQREKVIKAFSREGFFDESVIKELNTKEMVEPSNKKNRFRFLRILLVIFTNPYGIVIRRKKNHIYERTGALRNYLVKNSYFSA